MAAVLPLAQRARVAERPLRDVFLAMDCSLSLAQARARVLAAIRAAALAALVADSEAMALMLVGAGFSGA